LHAFPTRRSSDLVSDGVMIQMMARENSEVYQTDVAVLLESVRTAVAALAARQISETEMPAPHENAHKFQVRYAPSFIAGDHSNGDQGRAYTGTALASFLRITKKSTTWRNLLRQSNPAFLVQEIS